MPLSQTAANDYNPFGTGPENRDQVSNVVDSDPNTTWSTEQYYEGTLQKAGGDGLGLYLDAAPGVRRGRSKSRRRRRASRCRSTSPTTIAQLPYGDSATLAARGWHGPVGASPHVARRASASRLAVPRAYRYYLMWITTLPPGSQSATIAGITLLR